MFTNILTHLFFLSIRQTLLHRELSTNLFDDLEDSPSTYYNDHHGLGAAGTKPSYFDSDSAGSESGGYLNSYGSSDSSDSDESSAESGLDYYDRNGRARGSTAGRASAGSLAGAAASAMGATAGLGGADGDSLLGKGIYGDGGVGEAMTPRSSYQDMDNIERSKDMMSLVNTGIPEEKVQHAILKNRAESPDVINQAALLGSRDYYANNKNGSPSGALLAAAEAAGSAEVLQQKKDQALKKPLMAIQATKHVEDVGRKASAEYARSHPGALNSEILKAGAQAALEEERRMDAILEADKVSDAVAQQRYSQLKDMGLTHSEASHEAASAKVQSQQELESQYIDSSFHEPISPFDFSIPIEPHDYPAEVAAPTSEMLIRQREYEDKYLDITPDLAAQMTPEQLAERRRIIDNFDQDIVPLTADDPYRMDYSRLQQEEEDLIKALGDEINLKDSRDKDERAIYNQARDALGSEPKSEEFLKGMLDDTFDDSTKGKYEDLVMNGDVTNSDILDMVVRDLSEVDNFAKQIAEEDIGGELGLTTEMKSTLEQRGYSKPEVKAINTTYIRDKLHGQEERRDEYASYATSGKLREHLIKKREAILESIGKDSSLANLEKSIQDLLKEKKYFGIVDTAELSDESKAYGQYVGALAFQETHNLDVASKAGQTAALNRERAVDALNSIIDSKKAANDVLRANEVIHHAEPYVNASDRQKLNEYEKVRNRRSAVESAEKAEEHIEIAAQIEEQVENLRKDQAFHSLEAEKNVIASNVETRRAQIIEDSFRRVDVLKTTEALEKDSEERLKDLGIKKVIDDEQGVVTITDASLTFPLKVPQDIEAKNETENALIGAQKTLGEDLRNKVTNDQFDTSLNTLEGNDGNLNIGENAKELHVDEGLVIYPENAKEKMEEAGMDTSQLVEHVNQGENTKMAAGNVYYSAAVHDMNLPIPTPSRQTLSQALTGKDGSIIDTTYADQLYVDEGKLLMTPWKEFSTGIRPTMNKSMEREDVFTEDERDRLDEIKQVTDDIQDTITQAFINPDGEKIIKFIPTFGPAKTVTEEKANEMTQIDQQLGEEASQSALSGIINMEEYEDAITEEAMKGFNKAGVNNAISKKNALTDEIEENYGGREFEQKYKSEEAREEERAQEEEKAQQSGGSMKESALSKGAQSSGSSMSSKGSQSSESSMSSQGSQSSGSSMSSKGSQSSGSSMSSQGSQSSGSSMSSSGGSSTTTTSSSSGSSSSSSSSSSGSDSMIQMSGSSAQISYNGYGPKIDSFIHPENSLGPGQPNPLNKVFKEEAKIANEILENADKYISESQAKFNSDKLRNIIRSLPVEILKEYNQFSKKPYKDQRLMDPSSPKPPPNSPETKLLHKQSMAYITNLTGNVASAEKIDEIIFLAIKDITGRPDPRKLRLAEVKDIKVQRPSDSRSNLTKLIITDKPNPGPISQKEISNILHDAKNTPANFKGTPTHVYINNSYSGPLSGYVKNKIDAQKNKEKANRITFKPDRIYMKPNPAPRAPVSALG